MQGYFAFETKNMFSDNKILLLSQREITYHAPAYKYCMLIFAKLFCLNDILHMDITLSSAYTLFTCIYVAVNRTI